MHEIKFRAWIKRNNGEHYFMHPVSGVQFDNRFVWANGIQCYDFELMQFTGLKDKNGKEIFEGDVVNSAGDIYQVVFGEYSCDTSIDERNSSHSYTMTFVGWHLLPYKKQHDGDTSRLDSTDQKYLKIIGNIYENPELLSDNK